MHRLRLALAFLVGTTLLTAGFVAQSYRFRAYSREPFFLPRALLHEVSYWLLWVALLPLVALAGRGVPILSRRRLGLLPSVSLHVFLGALCAIAQQAGYFLLGCPIDLITGAACHVRQPFLTFLGGTITTFNLVLYWMILFATQMIAQYRGWRDENLKVAQLSARLCQAELMALKMQLQPHFLFNTLHAISALMYRDVEAANRMLVRLGDLLRRSLHGAGRQEVSLGDELGFLEDYLEIEQARFGDRLRVSIAVPSELLNAQVPNLILQPLVENAVRHGVGPRNTPGHIELRASRHGQVLRLEVLDDGQGLRGGLPREGIGLGNTRARLFQLYGAGQRLTLFERRGGGVHVTVELPLATGEAP